MLTITVNGVEYPLPVQTDEQQALLDRLYDAGRIPELVDPHEFQVAVRPGWPTPPATPWPRPRLGALYWPVVGLAHYAFGTFWADEYTVGQIRTGMTTAGTNAVTVNFYDDADDGSEVARSVPMYFLASRPLVRTTTDPLTTTDSQTEAMDGWVILLVDSRYTGLHGVGTLAYSTWASLFSAGSVTVSDTVDTDYKVPDATRWTDDRVRGRSTPWLLDVAAYSVGSRIVTVPGAAPVLQRPTAPNALVLTNAHNNAVADLRHEGGGPIENADVSHGITDSAKVTFGTAGEATPVTVTITGSVSAVVSHWADAAAATGSSDRSALAAQWLADWTAWQYDQYDTTYSGFIAAPASGFLWAVEWFHSADQGYTKFIRAPHWFGFLLPPGREPSASGVSTGCGLVDDAGTISVDLPSIAGKGLEVNTDEACDVLDVKLGCGLVFDGTDAVSLDTTTIAGPGLSKISTCSLQVNVGCGLAIPVDTVELDLTDVAQDGLYWNGETCVLGIDFGCGLTLVGPQLTVDLTQIAGTAATSSLIVSPPVSPATCPNLAVDLVSARTTTERLLNDIDYDIVGSTLIFTKVSTTYTNKFNAAGLLIDRTAAVPVTTTTYIQLCPAVECCLTTDCLDVFVETSPDPAFTTAGVSVGFDSTVTGGSGTPTYFWDFGDGTTSTLADPSHAFADPGLYVVVLTVTTDCAEARVEVPVAVAAAGCACNACSPSGTPDYLDLEFTGGKAPFDGLNGTWRLYKVEGCFWAWHQNGWSVYVEAQNPGRQFYLEANDGSIHAEWRATASQADCCTQQTLGLYTVSVGTEPTLVDDHVTPDVGTCGSCLECCGGTMPATLYAHFAGGTGSAAALDGLSVQIDYNMVSNQWEGYVANGMYCEGAAGYGLILRCETGATTYTLSQIASFAGPETTGVACNRCSPFELVWTGDINTPCGPNPIGQSTITINETP
jgi:hypothetical protein